MKLVPYSPSTDVSEPQAQIDKLITSNTGYGGVTRVEFKAGYFTVASVSGYGIFQQSVRYELVKKIQIYAFGGTHRVVVSDAQGEDLFVWGLHSLDDAHGLADAIASEVTTWTASTTAPVSPKQAVQ